MSFTQWGGDGENRFCAEHITFPNIKPGIYAPISPFEGVGVYAIKPKHDIIINTGLTQRVAKDIDKFLAARDLYKRFGFTHKRGLLLIGAPGTSKTITSMLLCQHVVKIGGVAIIAPTSDWFNPAVRAMTAVRQIHPDMPIINIMEEVEVLYNNEEEQESLMHLLDGVTQIDNVIHVATTNFPEKLDSRFLNRPGRFDEVIWVGPPDAATRRDYLKAVLPDDVPQKIVEDMVSQSDGLLLSHMRDLVCAVLVLGHPVKAAVERMRDMAKRCKEIEEARKKLEAGKEITKKEEVA